MGCLVGIASSLYLSFQVAEWTTDNVAAALVILVPCTFGTLLGALFGEIVALSIDLPLSPRAQRPLPLFGRVLTPEFLVTKLARRGGTKEAIRWKFELWATREKRLAAGESPTRLYFAELWSALRFLGSGVEFQDIGAAASVLALAWQILDRLLG